MQQQLNFRAPVTIGDTITATVEVIEVIREKKRVRLKTVCTNQDQVVVLDGEALISPPRN
jgi:3-hydroxybutyryl-CoA dehydratase